MKKEIISLTSDKRTFYLDYITNKILTKDEIVFDVMNPPGGIIQIVLRTYKLTDVYEVIDNAINQLNMGVEYQKLFIVSGQIFDNTIRTENFGGDIRMYLGLKII